MLSSFDGTFDTILIQRLTVCCKVCAVLSCLLTIGWFSFHFTFDKRLIVEFVKCYYSGQNQTSSYRRYFGHCHKVVPL